MQFIVFAFTYPFIWLLSKLPMSVLYVKSDIFYALIFYIFRYRKKVVLENLKLAFPEKPEKELLIIRKKFFKHFIDLIFESIKALTISEKEILKRYSYINPELINKYAQDGRSIALVGAHQANWEWIASTPLVLHGNVNGTYTLIQNKYFNKIIKKTREKFGVICVESSKTIKAIHKDFSEKKQGAYILISDQSPQVSKKIYWKEFLGIKVPNYTGAEALSKKFDLVVVNWSTTRVKRGFYKTKFELITDQPKDTENYSITNEYLRLTEEHIKKQPEFYLWSHKRFKHRNKYEEWKELNLSK